MNTNWKCFWRFVSIIICSIFGFVASFDSYLIYLTNNPMDPLPETTAIQLERSFIIGLLFIICAIVGLGTAYLIYKEFLKK